LCAPYSSFRYLLNTEGERQYFETYCLPGALTATMGGVGPNRRSVDSCEKSLLGLAVDRIGSQNCAAIPASAGTKDGGNRRAYNLVRDRHNLDGAPRASMQIFISNNLGYAAAPIIFSLFAVQPSSPRFSFNSRTRAASSLPNRRDHCETKNSDYGVAGRRQDYAR
jgi:hypothetical protein